jgi:PPM family protein phosphatase
MPLALRYSARSDVGLVRADNEDSGFASGRLLAVADGMGGHAAGELASTTVVATIAEHSRDSDSSTDVLAVLANAVAAGGARIGGFVLDDPARAGMGTTLTALAWDSENLALVHVGDSRAYRLRGGELQQITRDHTYVQSLVDSGNITEAEARVHPRRSLLLRAIDGQQGADPDLEILDIAVGDRYLVCSDGLSGVVPDILLQETLAICTDLTAAVTRLVDLALEGGAPDNVTVVVADVYERQEQPDGSDSAQIPVVVGAAGEQRNRVRLPGLEFPDDKKADLGNTDPNALDPIAVELSDSVAEQAGLSAGPADSGKQRNVRRPLALVGALAGVTLVLAVSFGAWLGSQWFVGVNQDHYVTVYQGVPQEIFGLEASRTVRVTSLHLSQLPTYQQELLLKSIDAASRNAADHTVDQLAKAAADCEKSPTPDGCTGVGTVPLPDPEAETSGSPEPTPAGSPSGQSGSAASSGTSAKPLAVLGSRIVRPGITGTRGSVAA